jgi:signal transduction histidine kinase
MDAVLRVLIVEDLDSDAQLILRELRHHGYDIDYERVETRPAMEQALARQGWDIILSDYSLPHFNAMQALATLKESGLDIPFLVISGTIDEETAVTALKAGAHDFLVKGRLARLVPAIEREMKDAETRRSHRQAEAERINLIASLEIVNAELERFLYTAFHDLRSPLVTIQGFLGMLNNDLQADRRDKIQSYIERISGAASKMDTLLSGLLKLAKVGHVMHPSEDVDLLPLTQEILKGMEEKLHSRNITVIISPDLPTIHGDRIHLGEVLENLIENAAKYTADQPNPVIEIGTRTQDDQQIIFVKDNGQGIDLRYQKRIFNLFEKLDPMGEGPGVGLALVKRIIDMHGGTIWVESEGEGQGSVFCFTIGNHRGQK